MAAEVAPLPPIRAPPGPAPLTPDQQYWRAFKNQLLIPSPHNAAITSITVPDHNPAGAQPENFAVTSGGRVQIYNTRSRKLVKTISRFGVDDVARSGTLRRDGRILLAGGDSGVLQAFDTGSRAILRQWNREEKRRLPIHTARWNPSVLTEFMSCGDDRTVKICDLTEDLPKWTGVGHEDYVRSGAYMSGQENMVVSGSYDQTVRLWDSRQQKPAMIFSHAAPIEDVIVLSNAVLAAAAGNEVSVLNLVAGKAEQVLRSHQKTVTALSSAQNGRRLLTGALDAHVKVHDVSSWEVVAGIKYAAPVLSLAVIPTGADRDDRHLAVGLQTGLLSLRVRLAGAEKVKAREREKKMQALMAGEADEYERKQRKKNLRQGIRARDRGKDFRGEGADIVVSGNDRTKQSLKKLKPWQKSLREGKYGLALDQVLLPAAGKAAFSVDEVLTLITALRHRSALRNALSNRDAKQLLPVLAWGYKYLNYPRHLPLVYDLLLLLLDLYATKMQVWQDKDCEEEGGKEVVVLVERIQRRVHQGVNLAQMAGCLRGSVEALEAG